ncbi:pyrroline-5-carboxylate reductase [Hoeflea prorocentri]|uniref:Pyrroline-5-carboxylate reductase n=1 Tax=Hoeflea prorocentri TaxID=1922333 RepID=A0A9X3ZFW2_9HYPH|nr:pyrroline-5-carboxylate reductase [Hoeflea prorocentri]MCY6379559.1 pyrroline-5-carboxylate reductase [Hoeflea prorocentri]MDA5397359.1 pyrroline-5-carboxylate reductase [Hoeflea prorocentri]
MTSGSVVLVGAGNMGGAMMRGWLASGIEPGSIVVVDPSPQPAMAEYLKTNGIRHYVSAPSDVTALALVIAVKPQMMGTVLPQLKPLVGADTVSISIAAGTPIATMERHLGETAIVRSMPNTPAMVGRGITAAVANGLVDKAQHDRAHRLLAVTGPVEWLDDEGLLDAVTAVSGSGPAYIFYLVECMAEAGRKAGLDADLSMRLARATVSGAGELLFQSDDEAATLRKNVTSPGGTTAAALEVLMREGGMQALFDEALAAAAQRSRELAEHG